jgi:hypothetical protein
MSLRIAEKRREDEPERNVCVYTALVRYMKLLALIIYDVLVFWQVVSQCCGGVPMSSVKEIKVNKFSISTAAKTQDKFNSIFMFLEVVMRNVKELVLKDVLNNILLRRYESLSILGKVVILTISDSNVSISVQIVNLDNVLTVIKGDGRPTRSCCEKPEVLKDSNMLCPCNHVMFLELCVVCAPILVGFQIIITCSVHAIGCLQSRGESQRYPRLYGTCPVIKTCLLFDIFKCL